MSQASITMDIRAQVTGYELSLAKFLLALSKLDPGSDIAKKISSAFKVAEKLVQSLGKNMLPKATNDTLIDTLVGKVNAAGESIREVMDLFSHIDVGDLDLSKIGGEFTTLTTKIGGLLSELDTKLNAGLLEAVKNSTELSLIFSLLGTDLSKADTGTLFTDMEKAANKAQDAVAEAEKKVTDLELSLNAAKTRESDLLKSPLGTLEGKLNLDDTVKNIESQYDNVFSTLRDKMKTGLLSLGVNDATAQNKLLDGFFNGLTPDNVRVKIEELFNTLKSSDLVSKKTEMYLALFGVDGNINAVIKNLNLNGLLEPIKELLHNLIESIKLLIGGKNAAKIEELIAKDDLENAAKTTLSVITKVYGNVQDAIVKEQQTTARLTTEMGAARAEVDSAKTNQTFIDNASILLKNDYDALVLKNVDLLNLINELKQLVANLLAKNVASTLAAAKDGGNIANLLHLSTDAARAYKEELAQVTAREQMVGKIQGIVLRWFSVYAAIRMVGNAVRTVISTIQELDRTITEIAIVTDMNQGDLWKQMPLYTALAREYAASINGVYQVSQLYYQQGLETADVLALTELTLKMARISGLDYALATDYMTNALRSFKMEMSDALSIVDVYSAIAAASATDTTELASAMSKTASSAEAVGSSFLNTTAMMAVMIEATRESAENIGSAMKSIISRYGEMTSDPSKLVDSEGQEMSLNRVDKALLTVGITIHDTMGLFKNFDDVIMELAEKWDTIDKNTLRYIATIMAGNRQQSRFLALVSSYDRLKELSETAANSEDASQLQFLKTLDSVDAKIQQFLTSVLDLYVNSGLENVYKGALDWANSLITTLDLLSTNDGLIVAIGKIGSTFTTLATLVTNIFSMIKGRYAIMKTSMQAESKVAAAKEILAETEKYAKVSLIYDAETQTYVNAAEERVKAALTAADQGVMAAKREAKAWEEEQAKMQKASKRTKGGMVTSALGLGATMLAGSLDVNENRGLKAGMTGVGAVLSGIGTGFMVGGVAGGIIGVLTALPGIIEAIGMASESAEERLKRLNDAATESNNKRIQTNAAYTDLKNEVDLVKELAKTYEDSAEAKAEYYEHSNAIAEQYPMLVSAYDGEGNAILNLSNAYEVLKKARGEASDAAIDNAVKSVEAAEEAEKLAKDKYDEAQRLRNFGSYNASFKESDLGGIGELAIELSDKYFKKGYESINLNGIILTLYDNAEGEELSKASPTSWLGKIFGYLTTGIGKDLFDELFSNKDNIAALKQEVSLIQEDYVKDALNWIIDVYSGVTEIHLEEEGIAEEAAAVTKRARKLGIALLTQLQMANAKLEADYNDGISVDYLSEFTAIGSIINDKIYSLWELAKQNNAELKFSDWIKTPEVTKEYDTLMQSLSDFWIDLDPDKQTELNTLIANRGKYTRTEFADKFEKLTGLVIDTNNELEEWLEELLKYYEDNFDVAKLNNAIEKRKAHRADKKEINLDTIISRYDSTLAGLGADELRNILSIYDSLEKKMSSGAITEKTGGDIFSQYIDLFHGASDEVQSLLIDTDIFSFSSIMDLIHTLEGEDFSNDTSAEKIKKRLEQLAHLIPLNLNTETETLTHAFNEGISDFESTIKNVTKGMNFKTMASEADKLGLEFSDFELKDGKYYIKDYLALSLLLIEDLNSLFEDLSKELDARKKVALDKSGDLKTRLELSDEEFNQLYDEYVKNADTSTTTFIDYYFLKKKEQLTSSVGAATAYANDLLARTALESGQIETFAKLAMGMNEAGEYLFDKIENDTDKEAIINAIRSGDISKIPEHLREHYIQFSSLVASTYTSIESSLATSLLGALSGGSKSITVTDTNISHLQDLLRKGWIKGTIAAGLTVTIADEVLKGNAEFETWLINTYTTEKDLLEALQKYHEALYSNNTFDNLASLQKNGTVNYKDFTNYLVKNRKYSVTQLADSNVMKEQADTYGLALNAAGNYIVTDWSKYVNQLTEDLNNLLISGTASSTDINAARAAVRNATVQQGNALREALKNIIDNYLAVTVNLQQALADSLSVDMATLDLYFTTRPDGTGTKELKIGAIKQAIADGTLAVAEGVGQYFREQILSIADAYLENITNATTLISKGTTNISNMEEFTKKYVELTGDDKTREALFNYDEIIDAWTLDTEVLRNYVIALAEELVKLGLMTNEQAAEYINNNVFKTLAKDIDISSFLTAENKLGQARDTLLKLLINYLKAVPEAIASYLDMVLSNLPDDIRKNISITAELAANGYINIILRGGAQAVSIMKAFAEASGTELSSQDIEDAWRIQVSAIEEAFELLTYGPGGLVNGKAKEILAKLAKEGKASIVELDSNNAVVTSITDISAAYQEYYNMLAASGEATLGALNEAMAKVLETSNGRDKELQAIDALNDASGMTYSAFAKIFTNAGIKLTDELAKSLEDAHIIENLGGNKMRIRDFAQFATLMNWQTDTEEYISAFKSYNDGLIELNRLVESAIDEEIKQLGSAKGGDWVNITQFYLTLLKGITAKAKKDAEGHGVDAKKVVLDELNKFSDALIALGAYIEDGILKIHENANLAGIATVLKDTLLNTGLDMQNELALILDTIDSIILSYIDNISNGMAGTLTHLGAQELVRLAKPYNVNLTEESFKQTAEGLLLTNESMLDLYASVRKMNQLSAKKLLPNMKDINSEYSDLAGVMKAYKEAVENGRTNEAVALSDLLQEYLSNPESFNFTRDKNTVQDEIAKNMYASSYKGYNTIRKSRKTSTMAYDDFTSIMALLYEFNPDLMLGGKSIKELYEGRFGYITYDKSGNPVFDLKAMGLSGSKVLNEFGDLFLEYSKQIIEKSNNQQESWIGVREAAKTTKEKVAQYTANGGKMDEDQINDIVKNSKELQSFVKSFGDLTLYDKLIGKKPLTKDEINKWNTFLKQFGDTDFLLENFTEQLSEIFGEDYLFELDKEGKLKISLKPEIKIGDLTIKDASIYEEWLKNTLKAFDKDINTEKMELSYLMGDHQVKFKVNIDAQGNESVEYTVTTDKGTYTSNTEAGLRLALQDAGQSVSDNIEEALNEPTTNASEFSYTIEQDYTVTYKDGQVTVQLLAGGLGSEADRQKLQTELLLKLSDKLSQLEDVDVDISGVKVKANGNYEIELSGGNTVTLTEVEYALLSEGAVKKVKDAIAETNGTTKIDGDATGVNKVISEVEEELTALTKKIWTIIINGEYKAPTNLPTTNNLTSKNSNINPSKNKNYSYTPTLAMGTALVGGRNGKTLMGELGPELYVTHGKYYIAGQNGAEFVNLPDDAIVFNHLQTKKLLDKGYTTNGKPFTSEGRAIGNARVFGGLSKDGKWSKDVNATTLKKPIPQLFPTSPIKNGFLKDLNKNVSKLLLAIAEEVIKKLDTTNTNLNNAADELNKAAEKLEQVVSAAEDVTKNAEKYLIVPDSQKLHTGYKRAEGYNANLTNNSSSTSAVKGKYKYTPSKTSGGGWSTDRIKAAYSKANGGSGSAADTAKTIEENLKLVANVISTLLSDGFETIDLSSSTFEKLNADMKSEMQKYIKRSDASYREFVTAYGEAANLSVQQFNEQYFEAWQKDIENQGMSTEIREAAKGLSFFSGGRIGGSGEDWTALFGEYTSVNDLVNANVIEWNEDLLQYLVTSIEALQEFDTNLDIDEFQDIMVDSLRETSKLMVDLLSKAESGSGTYDDFNKLNTYLKESGLEEISREYLNNTADGLVLSYKALAKKHQEAVDKNLSQETVEQLYDLKIKAIEDNNARVRENVERLMKFTAGAKKDAVDALTFFANGALAGTLDQLEALANSSEIDLNDILDHATWDSKLQQFVISNKNAIEGIDWNSVENIGDTATDSVREVFQQITDLLSKAESGAITYNDFNKLNAYFKESGLDEISREYLNNTTDGLILSYKVLAKKYQEAIDKNLSPDVVEQLYDLKIKAIEDNNARVRENTERSMKFTSGAERDAADALVFFANDTFAGTLDQLEALANSSEIDLTDILNNATWDSELQQFIVSNKNAIKGIDWDNIENIGIMVADSVREVSQQMTDLLSKAQSGDITYDEFNKLNVYLRESGLNEISKDALLKTANGLVITYEALAKTYAEMVAKGLEEAAKAVHEMLKTRAEAGRNSISDILSGNFTNWNDYVLDNDMKARLQEVTGRSMAQAVQVLDESTDGLAYTTQEYITEFMKGLSNDLLWDKAFSFDNAVLTDHLIRADFETLSQMFTKEEFKALQPNIIIDDKNRGVINRDFLELTLGKNVADRINTLLNAGAKTTAELWQEGLEEDNARILKNINTNSRLTSGLAKEAIELISFVTKDIFMASADLLESLANALGISMNAFLDNATWSEELQKYIVSDIHNIDGIDWSLIEGLDDFTKDSINDFFKSIVEAIKTGLSGNLTNVEATQLKGNLNALGLNNLELNFELGLEGLRLSLESAIHLYNELRKVDKILGELVFRELRTSLEESNDKYKTMTSLIVNIVDLQEKIDQADKYNDAKVKQYKEELALAKEIAAVRATSEDSSFNFLDQDIPGAMNNPLNYVKNWSNAWNELRDAATNNKAIDFLHFYNVLGEINNLAKASGLTLDFMGATLDGSLEAWDAAVNKSIDALGTDADKNYGVLLSKFGDNLTVGADAFAASADGAIHTMAKSQIKILDALILMFEAIVAMEDFEGADLNLNDILDFEEVFQDTELEELAEKLTEPIIKAATTLQEKFSTNGELRQAFEAVKVNGYSMAEIVEDAASGVRKLNLNAQDYAAALSVLYEMSKRGDFDINNIAESLREQLILNHSNFEGNIEYGDFIFNMHYNVQIKKDENGQYVTPSGETFDNADEAIHVAALEELAVVGAGTVENITVLADHTAKGTLTIASTEVTVDALASGIYYTVNDQQYNNLEAAESAIWASSDSDLSFGEWKLQLGLTVRMSIHEVKVENLTKDLIANAVGTTWQEVQAEWDAGVDQNGENLSFEAKYGISLDDNTTEADWERFKELAGIETKAVEVTANVQVTEGSLGLMLMLEKGSTTLNIEAAIDETSKLFTDGDFTSNLVVNLENAQTALAEFNSIVNGTTATEKVNSDTTEGENAAKTLRDLINAMLATITVAIDDKASDIIDDILEKLDKLKDLTITVEATENIATASDGGSQAKGNIAMAAGTRTLMGELGPELYVSNGRYHVAGENGAEFVNLPKDAIVFNHLLTQRLLSTGSTGRGRAITSEANAVALAKGGPAAANAQKTLATLKQLRAMWSKLAEASIVDLAGAVKNRVGSWAADVERWYNLLQKIARLEKEINYLEALRSKIEADRVPNGIEYYLSQVDSLKNLRELAATLKLLADSYDEYFETRRKELNASPLSKFYEFNEAGQVQYKEGGLLQLASLFTLDDTGKAKYTPKQQYDMLQSMGLGEYMLRDSNGLAIERDNNNIDLFYYDSVQAAYERMTAELQEMQDLYNNKEEAKVAYLEAITKADKLLLDIIDNLMDMELKVLDAIETREQKIIDKITKERQALADSSAKYFEGLELALNKEREMYSRLQDQDSLTKLQRRLSILQRSGGSASEIASLQQEITDKQRDAYFEAQETAIQEAKDASDLQLEKMQELIDLMTETLEYEKANGLLWGEVATILSGTSESIMEFITTNMPEWLAKSATALNEELRTLRNSTLQWVAYYNNGDELVKEMMGGVQESVDNLALDLAKRWNEEIQKSSPLQLSSPAIDTLAAAIEAVYENSNNNTQIDKLEYNVNVKNIADAQETERLVLKAMMEGEEPWKNAFKRSPVNNSMCKRGYK